MLGEETRALRVKVEQLETTRAVEVLKVSVESYVCGLITGGILGAGVYRLIVSFLAQ